MKNVAIVGAGGVGAAHLCAAVRCGIQVRFIIDTDPRVLGRLARCWSNRWLEFEEEVPRQEHCESRPHLVSVLEPGIDLAIIAVPPAAQCMATAEAAIAFPNATLLVEKPIALDPGTRGFLKDRIRMSAEWIYTEGLEVTDDDSELGMAFPWTPKASGWTIPAFDDFMPHLASILVRKYGPEFNPCWNSLHRSYDAFTGLLCFGHDAVHCWGDRLRGPHGLHVEEAEHAPRVFGWQEDLFDRQLMAEGGPGLSHEEIEAVLRITEIAA